MLPAFIINLETAKDRWASIERSFAGTPFAVTRVPGIIGNALEFPIPEYSEDRYRRYHGRPTSPGHVGCYLSHVRALGTFLATAGPHALIGEDDLTLGPDFAQVVERTLALGKHWDLVRLTGLGRGGAAAVGRLTGESALCVNFQRLKGTGAYLVNRRAAEALVAGMLPMWLPIDHALDREWVHGLRAASVFPFPASQVESGFRSSIHRGKSRKEPALSRLLGTYPFQVYNEISRFFFRGARYLRLRSALR